jgi:pimeloyl-ACP methyl ester carboxylesterase
MPHTYGNGTVTFYEDSGEGPAVVLIHGHAADLRIWARQVPELTAAGYRAVRYDVRGHGRSMVPPAGYTWDNYARDLAELLDRLNIERPASKPLGVERAHLVGLSMGGGIALQFALDYPERALSLTLVDSALPGFGYSEEFSSTIQDLVQAVREMGVRPAFERYFLTHPMLDGIRRYPDRFQELSEIILGYQAPEYQPGYEPPPADGRPQAVERLAEVRAPALVIVGEQDLEDFRLIAGVLAGNLPKARKVVLPGCGHIPPLEDPERFNRVLLEFLAAV